MESATKKLKNWGEAWEMGMLGSFVAVRMVKLNEAPVIQQVDHYVRLTRNDTLLPMQVHKTVGVAKIPVLTKCLNGVEAITSYETFKQGGNRLTIGLQNGTREKIILKKGTKVAKVITANVVPPMLAPDQSTDE